MCFVPCYGGIYRVFGVWEVLVITIALRMYFFCLDPPFSFVAGIFDGAKVSPTAS